MFTISVRKITVEILGNTMQENVSTILYKLLSTDNHQYFGSLTDTFPVLTDQAHRQPRSFSWGRGVVGGNIGIFLVAANNKFGGAPGG